MGGLWSKVFVMNQCFIIFVMTQPGWWWSVLAMKAFERKFVPYITNLLMNAMPKGFSKATLESQVFGAQSAMSNPFFSLQINPSCFKSRCHIYNSTKWIDLSIKTRLLHRFHNCKFTRPPSNMCVQNERGPILCNPQQTIASIGATSLHAANFKRD